MDTLIYAFAPLSERHHDVATRRLVRRLFVEHDCTSQGFGRGDLRGIVVYPGVVPATLPIRATLKGAV